MDLMRLRLFGGKGGVGKTTLAAAAAVGAAEGREGAVLVVSTDPAHSLGDALAMRLGSEPRPVKVRRGRLWAAEMDAGTALTAWLGARREELVTLAERGTFLDREDVAGLLGLGLPGVDELIGLIEAVRMARQLGCDELILDTAPTAHTLRLLGMPATLRGFAALLARLAEKPRLMAERFGGGWRPDEADAAAEAVETEAREIEALLRDDRLTAFTWVLLPEAMAVAETWDGLRELAELGVPVGEVVVNRVTPPSTAARCPICAARRAGELVAVAEVRREVPEGMVRLVAATVREPRGVASLRPLARALATDLRGAELLRRARAAERRAPAVRQAREVGESGTAWLGTLVPPGVELLLVGGKGGVGKTTCAAAVALAAARLPGARVVLLSADPAHSLGDALGVELGDEVRQVAGAPPGLLCREVDPESALTRWRSRFGEAAEDLLAMLTGLPRLEAGEMTADLLGLTPPGLDELAVLDALMDLFPAEAAGDGEGGPQSLVIVDTAPTGHALRLLAMPETALEWDHALLALLLKYREAVSPGELAAELVELSRGLKRLSALLRDSRRARFAVVTRAAELPRRETLRLLAALGEAGVAPAAVVVNALPLASPVACQRCAAAVALAERQVARLSEGLARPGSGGCAMIFAPAAVPPPRGVEALAAWSRTWRSSFPFPS